MTQTTVTERATAHIITPDAIALGDPGVVITGRVEDCAGDRVIEHLALSDERSFSALAGWRTTGEPTLVEPGYWIVEVERA